MWYCSSGCTFNKIISETQSEDGKCNKFVHLKLNMLFVILAPLCFACSRQMIEYTKLRKSQTYRLLRVIPARSTQTPRPIDKIYRSVTVNLKGKFILLF